MSAARFTISLKYQILCFRIPDEPHIMQGSAPCVLPNYFTILSRVSIYILNITVTVLNDCLFFASLLSPCRSHQDNIMIHITSSFAYITVSQ